MYLNLDTQSATATMKALSVSLQSATLGLSRLEPGTKQWNGVYAEWCGAANAMISLIEEIGDTLDEKAGPA